MEAQREGRSVNGRLKAYLQTVLQRKPAGHGLTVFPEDIFLTGYFRSGSTWCRFLFGNYICQDKEVTFANLNDLVPSIYVHPDRILRRLPRVIKSHESFDPRYPRTVYIVRDPRDVAVSFYYYNLKVRVLEDGYWGPRTRRAYRPLRRGAPRPRRGARGGASSEPSPLRSDRPSRPTLP